MKKNYILCGLAALLTGCSLGDEALETSSEYAKITKVGISVEPFELGEDAETRTSYTFSEATGMSFSWSAGDTLGVFPINPSGSQVYQVLKEKGNETTGVLSYSFDGDAWLLKGGNSYASYHPFAHSMKLDEDYKSVPVNMTGQKQNGNVSTAHLGNYHIMYAPPVSVPAGSHEVNLDFHNVNGLIKVDLKVPVAATWKKLVFESDNAVFITSALMDATNGKVTPKETSNSIELELKNVTSTANQTLTFFISLLPTTTGEVSLSAITSDNVTYTASLPTKTVVAGKIYRWNAELDAADEYSGKDYVLLAGSLWCRYNLNISGAAGGEYYAWAERTTKTEYTWDNYKFGTSDDFTRYYPSDGNVTIKDRDDVALKDMTAPEGGHWRIPTKAEMDRLINNCTWTWNSSTSSYKVSDPNNKNRYIELPTTSMYGEVLYGNMSDQGFYWTSDVEQDDTKNWSDAYCLWFNSGSIMTCPMERMLGLMIRPVFIKE